MTASRLAGARATRTILRCTGSFAALGLVLGTWAMLERVSPMAESGSQNVLTFAPWIPILTIVGTVLGAVVGAVTAVVGAGMRYGRR